MLATIEHLKKKFRIDFSKPIDISIPLREGKNTVNAYYAPGFKTEPVKMGNWIGEVKQGAAVNFRNVFFNPHGNGTHTECIGHISREDFTINQCLKEFFFVAELISVKPEKIGNDLVITKKQVQFLSRKKYLDGGAIIIRTFPNSKNKLIRQYSGTNPAYIHHEAISFFVSLGIKHLLVDMPSVDQEEDGGKLLAHRAFWGYNLTDKKAKKSPCTITELIYVPDEIGDGAYLLNLQIASFENDAAPSRPVLFKVLSF